MAKYHAKKEFCVPSKEGAHYVYYLVANTLKALAHVCLLLSLYKNCEELLQLVIGNYTLLKVWIKKLHTRVTHLVSSLRETRCHVSQVWVISLFILLLSCNYIIFFRFFQSIFVVFVLTTLYIKYTKFNNHQSNSSSLVECSSTESAIRVRVRASIED